MTTRQRPAPARRAHTLDQALIALFIGAMNANGNVAPDEAARAHHLIWSMRRFRRKSGDVVGRLIGDGRAALAGASARAALTRATAVIPARLRAPAFAVVVDLLLADGRIEGAERRFLRRLGAELDLSEAVVADIVRVIALKNQL